jgi:hypothetical protein
MACFNAVAKRLGVILGLVLLLACPVWAEVPAMINYQGRLVDQDTGAPLSGAQEIVFRIFDAETGGTALWSETQSVTPDTEGVFSVMLGNQSEIDLTFENPVWLEVEVEGQVLAPRREIVSVPFAFRSMASDHAGDADSLGGSAAAEYVLEGEIGVVTVDMIAGGSGSGLDADMLDSLHADAFADTGHDHDVRYYLQEELNSTGLINDSGNPVDWTKLKGVPVGFADGIDNAGGTGDGHSLDASDGSPADAVYVDETGDVGIGTTTPDNPVHIWRDANSSTGITIENPNTGANSIERILLQNEDGGLAGIVAYDDDHLAYPGQMMVYNNRPNGELVLSANAVQIATLKDGNLGVLQSDPAYRLDVNGTARFTGFMMPPGASSGHVLTSDPTGYATWQAPAAVSDGDWTVVGDTTYCDPTHNVGIGTASPRYPLNVRRDVNDYTCIEVENRHTGMSSAQGISLRDETGGVSTITCHDNDHMQYPGQMVIRSNTGSLQLHLQSHVRTCLFADSSTYIGVGHTSPRNRLHVEGSGTDEGGVTGFAEVNTRVKTTGGNHSALSVDAITDRDAIVYLAESGEAIWDIRNDADDANKFQLRYHGGIALSGKHLTVDTTGNVGVGTVYPERKIHVYENAPGEVSYGLKLDNPSGTAETSTGIQFKVDGGGSGRGKGAIVYERADTWNRGDFHVLQDSDASPDEVELADAVMTVRNNGNVGIGTTLPSSRFEVQRDDASGRLGFFKISSASNNGDVIRAETSGGGNALSGSSQSGRGVVGHSASDYAGYFTGDVYVTGNINKAACSFVIDHPLDPENKILRHNCVESPEHLLIYRGKVRLDDNGEGLVEMAAYFKAVADEEEASIHLTSVGRPFLTGAEWKADFGGFTVYGDPGREVFWEVLAERDDPVIRSIARPVEEEKGPDNKVCDKGNLLQPVAFGYPETMGQDYQLLQGLSK